MLTIEEIKKELDAVNNVELECVDSIGFLGAHHRNQSILMVGRLVVSSVDDTGVHLKDCFPGISPEELKYFRIKRPAPTFDDLIDVAVKAVKNRALFTMSIGDNKRKGRYLNYAVNGNSPTESFYESDDDYQACIDFINSLYTETITINGVEIPKPLSELDIKNSSTDDVFYVPSYNSSLFISFSRMYILRGGDILVYATKEEAIEASKALFGIEG